MQTQIPTQSKNSGHTCACMCFLKIAAMWGVWWVAEGARTQLAQWGRWGRCRSTCPRLDLAAVWGTESPGEAKHKMEQVTLTFLTAKPTRATKKPHHHHYQNTNQTEKKQNKKQSAKWAEELPICLLCLLAWLFVLTLECLEMPVAESSRIPRTSQITVIVLFPTVWVSSSFLFSCPEEPQRLPEEIAKYSGMMFTSWLRTW